MSWNKKVSYNLGLLSDINKSLKKLKKKAIFSRLKIVFLTEALESAFVFMFVSSNQNKKAKNRWQRLINSFPNKEESKFFLK
jgi:hypothetical protein